MDNNQTSFPRCTFYKPTFVWGFRGDFWGPHLLSLAS